MSLNLKLSNVKLIKQSVPKRDVEKDTPPNVNAFSPLLYIWSARCSCMVLLFPLLLFGNNQNGVKIASCLYLILMPLSSFFLHLFSFQQSELITSKFIACILGGVCMILGNVSAVLFLVSDNQYPFIFLSVALSLGSTQLLFILPKKSIFRVMFCTAVAVVVVFLSILAFIFRKQGKNIYQIVPVPFLLLFFEVTRSYE